MDNKKEEEPQQPQPQAKEEEGSSSLAPPSKKRKADQIEDSSSTTTTSGVVNSTSPSPTEKTGDKQDGEKKEESLIAKVDEFLASASVSPEEITLDDPRKADEVFGLVKRQTVYMKRQFEHVHLIEFDSISCTGAPVIISFPSIGLVGVLTGKQIVKTLNLPLIGIIKVKELQVACVVSHEQPSHPGRIYGNEHCVIFICEMALQIPPDAMQNLIQCIYDFAHRHRSPNIYVLEGIPKPHRLKLPTGEEVEIRINGDDSEREEESSQHVDMLVDDSVLTQLIVRERLKAKANATTTESNDKKEEGSSSVASTTSAKATADDKKKKKKKKHQKGLSSLLSNSKKRSAAGAGDGDEDDEEKNGKISKLADKLFGDEIHYVTTCQDLAIKLRKLGYIPVVDGIIPGVAGGLLAEAPLKTKDVTVLLAPTSTLFPDPDSAILVLKLLHLLHPNIGLEKVAQELEKDVVSLKKMMKGIMQNLTSSVSLRRSSSGVPQGMYQ